VTAIQGDLGQLLDPLASGPDMLAGADVVFHLAAAVSGECETDFDLGIRANLRATEALLASGRALGTNPVVVFSSSLAVFGGSEDLPLPRWSTTRPGPTADQLRRAESDVRAVAGRLHQERIPAWSRPAPGQRQRAPGRPNAAASGFMSVSSGSRWPGSVPSAR